MNRIINRLVSDATAPIGEMSARLFKKAVLFFLLLFLGLSCVCVSAIFLTFALFVFLRPLEGNVEAALCVAGLYLVAAGVCVFFATRAMTGQRRQVAASLIVEKEIMPSENADYAQKTEFANTIDETDRALSRHVTRSRAGARAFCPRGRRGDRETIASFLAGRLRDGCWLHLWPHPDARQYSTRVITARSDEADVFFRLVLAMRLAVEEKGLANDGL